MTMACASHMEPAFSGVGSPMISPCDPHQMNQSPQAYQQQPLPPPPQSQQHQQQQQPQPPQQQQHHQQPLPPPPQSQQHQSQQQQQQPQNQNQNQQQQQQQTQATLETSYVMQNGKPVRVVRVVHYVQAPPGGMESLSPHQQQQLMAEARATIQCQRPSPGQGAVQSPKSECQPSPYSGWQHPPHNPVPPPPPAHTSPLGVPHMPHSVWPANPASVCAQQRPTVGSMVMLSGGEPFSKCALRLGEVGKVVEDDGSFVPFAVQGPRGDTDWYGEREVSLTGERQLTKDRQVLGDQIFARVAEAHPETAAKVTGMILDALDDPELSAVLSDPCALRQRVQEAHTILHYHSLPACMRQNGVGTPQSLPSNLPPDVAPLMPCSPPLHPGRPSEDDISLTSPFSFDTPSVLKGEGSFNSQLHPNEIPSALP